MGKNSYSIHTWEDSISLYFNDQGHWRHPGATYYNTGPLPKKLAIAMSVIQASDREFVPAVGHRHEVWPDEYNGYVIYASFLETL